MRAARPSRGMSTRVLLLVGLPVSFVLALVIFWSAGAIGAGVEAASAAAGTSFGVVAVVGALQARERRRLRVDMPPPLRPARRRRALTYREGGRPMGAPWGLLLAEGDPYAVPALETYAAAASAAGEEDVAEEVRETLARWKERNPC